MTTSASDAPLMVSTDGTAGPYVIVTPEQIRPVTEALRADGIRFQVDNEAVLPNGAEPLAVIELGRGADVQRVQGVLDRVATDLKGKGRRRRRSATQKMLVVWGDPEPMQQLRTRLDGEAVGGWARQPDVETRYRTTLPERTLAYCFSKRVPAINRHVAVLMQGRGKGNGEELSVSRVVPLEGRQALDRDQHDKVITDIHESLIEPLSRDLGVRILAKDAYIWSAFEEALSSEALTRLLEFSAVANKNNLHSLDMQRWSAFIRQAHHDEAVIDPTLLAAWLAEGGFPSRNSELLVQEYESGRRILNEYDEERR
jgi:hypothetical protein